MPTSINGSSGGGASAPSGTGVATVSGGAFVSPVPSAATTRATLGLGSLATASSITASQISDATTAGRALVTAADAAAQRTALAVVPSSATPLVESGAGAVGTSADYARADHVHPAAGGGGGTWLSLYGGSALWMGGDSAFGWAQADRFSASAGAVVPAFGPGQSIVVCLYPGATPTGTEVITSHLATGAARGWYLSVGSNAGARRRLAIFFTGLNGGADLYLTSSDFTVGAAYVIAIAVLADKSVRYSVNGGTVQVISALSGSYTVPTSSDTFRVGSLTEFSPTFYPPVSVLVGAVRCYSTELSDADLVAACAGVATASIPTVATGTVSADFSAAAFAGGRRVVAASPTPTWIAAGNPAIRPV